MGVGQGGASTRELPRVGHRAGHGKGLVPPDSPEGLGEVLGRWDGNWGSRPRACLWRGSATAPAAMPAPQSLLCRTDGLTHRALRGPSQARAPRALCLLPVFPPLELCATRDVSRSHLRPLRSSAAWLPRFSYKRDRQTHAVTRPLKGFSSHAALTPASPSLLGPWASWRPFHNGPEGSAQLWTGPSQSLGPESCSYIDGGPGPRRFTKAA